MDIRAVNDFLASMPSYGDAPDFENLSDDWICAFPNGDMERVLCGTVIEQKENILAGMALVEAATGKDCAGIIAPDARVSEAFDERVLAVEDFVHVREHRDISFIHPLRLAQLARFADEGKRVFWVAADGDNVHELEADTALSELFPDFDGKAVLINHRFYPSEVLNTPLGNIDLGSGVIRAVGKGECMLQAALSDEMRLYERSCGVCTFCREGLYQITTTLNMMQKPGTQGDKLEVVKELGAVMPQMAMCSVGREAAEPIMSALELFPDEISAHIGRGKCPTGKCSGYMSIYIDPMKCQADGACMDVCPADCIDGKHGFISVIDTTECSKCGKCISVCENNAIILTGGRVPRLPQRPTRVGRFR